MSQDLVRRARSATTASFSSTSGDNRTLVTGMVALHTLYDKVFIVSASAPPGRSRAFGAFCTIPAVEERVAFRSDGLTLAGVLHRPAGNGRRAAVLVVARVGRHQGRSPRTRAG